MYRGRRLWIIHTYIHFLFARLNLSCFGFDLESYLCFRYRIWKFLSNGRDLEKSSYLTVSTVTVAGKLGKYLVNTKTVHH